MKIAFFILVLTFSFPAFSVVESGKFNCEDDSVLELIKMNAKFHDARPDEDREIEGLSILNAGRSIQLKFDNKSSVICHKSKFLFL